MKCAKLLMKTEKESLKLTENKAFRLITEKIKKSKKVLLIGHRSPDLDCVGSLVSFFYVLKSREKDVRVLSDFKHSAWTNFNNPEISSKVSREFNPDLVIMVDYSNRDVLELGALKFLEKQNAFIITIDHHKKHSQLGDLIYIDDSIHSCCEILSRLFFSMKVDLTEKTRTALLTGMLHDTGIFAYYPLTLKSMRTIIRLNKTGEEFQKASLLSRSWNRVDDFVRFSKYATLMKIDRSLGFGLVVINNLVGDTGSLTSSISNQSIFIREIKSILVLKKIKGQRFFRASIRSSEESGIDVSKIAAFFNGGGHKKAAGFQSSMSSVKIIAKVKELIWEQIKNSKGKIQK